jgi:predicted DNA-binding protein YlxM (UPF0122 family)
VLTALCWPLTSVSLLPPLTAQNHELLDFTNTAFERDFVEFTMKNSGLENAIQEFLETTLQRLTSIEKKLDLLQKFEEVLHRDALRDDLDQKYQMVFKMYGVELQKIDQDFKAGRAAPQVARNMPPVAGKIHWARQLWRQIRMPMMRFVQKPHVFATWQRSLRLDATKKEAAGGLASTSPAAGLRTGNPGDGKSALGRTAELKAQAASGSTALVETNGSSNGTGASSDDKLLSKQQYHPLVLLYNSVFQDLFEYEQEEFNQWKLQTEKAKAGLRKKLLVKHAQTEKLHVNFDHQVFIIGCSLSLASSRCLCRLSLFCCRWLCSR